MSLYGALYSGVSGLLAQSSSLSSISDNIVNVNTTGYKGSNSAFNTLVTSQSSRTSYSAGGVQYNNSGGIDAQGLLSSSSSSTDLAISGDGFFVVNESATPGQDNLWAYTRAGSFKTDEQGYLKNTGDFYIQAWPLMTWDGNKTAATVEINGITYMKAYKDGNGETVYINDNIIDANNLKAVNLNTLGGTASRTQNISFGANLPSSASIGSNQTVSVLSYDSLGNSHNLSFIYSKESSNSWGVDIRMPSGAATLTTYTTAGDVYASEGQLEFTEIPANHSIIKITDGTGAAAKTFVFEFSADGTNTYVPAVGETLSTVNISSIADLSDVVDRFKEEVDAVVPCSARFTVSDTTMLITQSVGGSKLTVDTSKTLACLQSSANIDQVTGLATGIFSVEEIDWGIKNGGRITFESTDPNAYVNKSVVFDNTVYTFRNGGGAVPKPAVAVDISSAITAAGVANRETLVEQLMSAIRTNASDTSRYTASGTSIEFAQTASGDTFTFNATNVNIVNFNQTTALGDYDGEFVWFGGNRYKLDAGSGGDIDITSATGATATELGASVASLIYGYLKSNDLGFEQYQVNGSAIISSQAMTIPVALATATNTDGIDSGSISGQFKNYGKTDPTEVTSGTTTAASFVVRNSFYYNGNEDGESGAKLAAIRFNSDGTPMANNIENIAIEWANGAADQDAVDNMVKISSGHLNTTDGLTHLAGSFSINYVSQDGAKFGAYSGVTIGKDGVITALFDNGETKAIGIIPVATFTNANGLTALTGNSWIATDKSGSATLRTAGDGGSGEITSYSLENSTVDLATEFTNMITTQRAYSAASKIITVADEMLDELINIKR